MQAESSTRVPFGAWYGDDEIELRFPDGWQVHRLDADDAPGIDEAAVREAFECPLGTARIRELAGERQSAVIAVDDLTRPTPTHRVLPHVLREIEAGGIAPGRIVVLVGTAAHRPMDDEELEKKLGPGVRDRYTVVQHDFMGDDIRFVGWHEGGPVHLNRHFLDAELRLCIGGVIPHNETGFGGGSKMIVPGVAGRPTIAHFHGALPPRLAGVAEPAKGVVDRRAWSESVARFVGVDAVVACAINTRRELAGLVVGDVVEAHRAAARLAAAIGRTAVPRALAESCDVAVVNAYPLDTDPIQMGKSINLAKKLGARSTVVVNAASDGIFYHGMGMGSGLQAKRLLANLPAWLTSPRDVWTWARSTIGGVRQPLLAARLGYFTLNHLSYAHFGRADGRIPRDTPVEMTKPQEAEPLVYSKQFPAWGFRRKYGKGHLFDEWEAIARVLDERFGRGTALVFPCAPLQLPEIVDS